METLASGDAAPAIADNTALADSGTADAKPEEATGDGSAPSVPEADTPKPDRVQERFDKLTREKYDALRERDRNSYEIERLRAEIEQHKAPKPEIAPQNEFPTLEQFGYDEGKFNSAIAAHFSKIATEQAKTVAREQIEAERRADQQKRAGELWASKEAEFIKSQPDYVEKVRNPELKITPDMAQVIRESEFGPQVAYHFAENPEKAAAIAQLPPLAQAREIGRIEARFEAEKAKPKPVVSQAPPPPARVDAVEAPGSVSTTDPASDKLTDDEWVKKELARMRKKRRA